MVYRCSCTLLVSKKRQPAAWRNLLYFLRCFVSCCHVLLQGAVSACMIGSSIAIRYSAQRPQFGNKLIMDYLSHQRRLLPGLAATYALHLGLKQLKVLAALGSGFRA